MIKFKLRESKQSNNDKRQQQQMSQNIDVLEKQLSEENQKHDVMLPAEHEHIQEVNKQQEATQTLGSITDELIWKDSTEEPNTYEDVLNESDEDEQFYQMENVFEEDPEWRIQSDNIKSSELNATTEPNSTATWASMSCESTTSQDRNNAAVNVAEIATPSRPRWRSSRQSTRSNTSSKGLVGETSGTENRFDLREVSCCSFIDF